MATDLMKHVIEKRHTRAGLAAAAAVKSEPHVDIGLPSNAVNLPSTHAFWRRSTPRDCLDHRE
jgi:hypothetical protein